MSCPTTEPWLLLSSYINIWESCFCKMYLKDICSPGFDEPLLQVLTFGVEVFWRIWVTFHVSVSKVGQHPLPFLCLTDQDKVIKKLSHRVDQWQVNEVKEIKVLLCYLLRKPIPVEKYLDFKLKWVSDNPCNLKPKWYMFLHKLRL